MSKLLTAFSRYFHCKALHVRCLWKPRYDSDAAQTTGKQMFQASGYFFLVLNVLVSGCSWIFDSNRICMLIKQTNNVFCLEHFCTVTVSQCFYTVRKASSPKQWHTYRKQKQIQNKCYSQQRDGSNFKVNIKATNKPQCCSSGVLAMTFNKLYTFFVWFYHRLS